MQLVFYRSLIFFSDILGEWFFMAVSRMVAAGYFILFPRRVAVSVDFYQALIPGKRRVYYLGCVWKQYQNFTSVFLDRVRVRQAGDIRYAYEGGKHLDAIIEGRQGGVVLMSHLGNWEVASYLLQKQWPGTDLMLYMGKRQKEEIERFQKQELSAGGINIVAVDSEGGSPFDIVDGVRFLKNGGLVAMAGDVVWKDDQRSVTVPFLGRSATFPAAPHVLALLAGVPLLVFFSFQTGKKQYAFSFSAPIRLKKEDRRKRGEEVERSVREYAVLLEAALCNHPFEWYHFTPFLVGPVPADTLEPTEPRPSH